jgi:deoxycytidine triphosphate deaminase
MSVYSNKQIRQAIVDGHIICHPFIPSHVEYTSLDITLGFNYYRIERTNERTIYNPLDREDVERYFDGPYKALTHGEWCELNGLKPANNIALDHPIISIKPGERILAHSHEFVGILPPGAAEVRARSNWSKNGIAVNSNAGWITPGDINRLTLEIVNLNERETVLLPVGERIAQVIFHDSGAIEGNYRQEREGVRSHNEQQSRNLDTIIKIWAPDMVLPRAYVEKLSIPQKIEGLTYD